MNQRQGVLAACGGIFATFLAIQLGALALVRPFKAAGYQTVQDPQNPINSVLYVGVLLVATAAILVALKYGGKRVLRAFIVLTGAMITVYVAGVLPGVIVGGPDGVNVLPWLAAAVLVVALYVYPEWWVIDLAGVVMGAGAAALFGISFGVLPAIVLLGALAVYDAISVYGTEHMLTLASGVVELKVPVLLVYPTVRGYSFRERAAAVAERDDETDDEAGEDDGETDDVESTDHEGEAETHGEEGRDSIMIGLGDAVMPTVMVASAAFFVTDVPSIGGVPIPAATAIVGTMLGLLILLRMVLQGRAHAGLPLLNGGAILGYLVGALAAGLSVMSALGLGPYL
ncbi:presenilin family intramembrane aspartyl protease PSH [Halarchaeum salinum]|uniref:Presenilin family intramembrane aspartyl protease n=1 Tax=Halarchaeum salinum TaxID=489912 RepID=A0AAV3S820_9EURY